MVCRTNVFEGEIFLAAELKEQAAEKVDEAKEKAGEVAAAAQETAAGLCTDNPH